MKTFNTARVTLLSATAAAVLAATAGIAAADNAVPTTTTQPSQQQTGITEPAPQQPSATSVPAAATEAAAPARIWTKRSERGTNTHGRGSSH